MAHKLFQAYSTKGMDTRTNRLSMDPLSMREGSLDIIVDHNSDLTQRYGFGHVDAGGYVSLGEVEYKYIDPDSGASTTELLQIRNDGKLYRRKQTDGLSISATHSMYFDGTTFSIVVGATTILFDESKTLTQLSTDLTTSGVTNTVLGDGNTLAYLLGTFVNENGSHYATTWEVVPYPDVVLNSSNVEVWNSVPFPEALSGIADEGISAVNLNNCIYLTVGGFPMKYDGKMVYRAGVPKMLTPLGNRIQTASTTGLDSSFGTVATGTGLPNGAYYYIPQYGYRDASGAVYWGAVDGNFESTNRSLTRTVSVADRAIILNIAAFQNGKDFGAASCVVASNANIPLTGGTITVSSGHNVKVGMCLMQPCYTVTSGGNRESTNFFSYYAAKVSAVTQTSITLETAIPLSSTVGEYTGNFIAGEYIGAAFVSGDLENKWLVDYDGASSTGFVAQEPFGAFVRYWRSKVGAPDVLYRVIDLPVPYQNGSGPSFVRYSYFDNRQDSTLLLNRVDFPTGGELPRAARYLTKWQSTLTQAGRPVDSTLKDDTYPSWTGIISTTIQGVANNALQSTYTEAHLCDEQSIYWADQNNLEGFPQDGLFENRIDTNFNDRVKGIKENKDSLFVLKERSTALVRGDLGQNDIVTEILETDAGCMDHRSIAEVEGSIIWCDLNKGFWSCVAGRLPQHIGFAISDQFMNDEIQKTFAVAQVWDRRDLYICYLTDAAFVFDYAEGRGFWYQWSPRFKSLTVTADDELFASDGTRLWKAKDTLTKWDCSDYKSAITAKAVSAWQNFKFPTIDKKFHRVWVNSIQGDFTLTVEQYANYLSNNVGSISLSFLPESSKKFVKKEVKLNMEKLSAISLAFAHNTAAERMKIQGWELEYSTDYDFGEPKD